MAEDLFTSTLEILPTTVILKGIDITELLAKFQLIIKEADLDEMSGFNLGFNFSGKTMSLTWKDKESFTITSGYPEVLQKVIEAIKTLFDSR